MPWITAQDRKGASPEAAQGGDSQAVVPVGSGRIAWVDTAKALLIFLVVLGHLDNAVLVKKAVYAFHVPAFLVLTGFLLPAGLSTMPAGRYGRKYLLPYARLTLFFGLLSAVMWIATMRGPGDPGPGAALLNALFGANGRGQGLIHGNAPLWYLGFLVSSMAVLLAVTRLPRTWWWPAALAAFGFSLLYAGPRLPWSLDNAGTGAAFILCGFEVRRWLDRRRARGSALPVGVPALAAAAGLLWIATVAIAKLNGTVNLNLMAFGRTPLLFVAGALSGTAAMAATAMLLPDLAIFRLLSRGTLVIFCTHGYLIRPADRLIDELPSASRLPAALIAAAAIAVLCALLAKATMPALERWVIGRPPRGRDAAAAIAR